MRELAVIVPTRGRPENIRRVLEAWDFTEAWADADLILALDADDPEIGRYYELAVEWPRLEWRTFPQWQPMVPKLNATALLLAEGDHEYRALGFAGDDHLPQTIGWARRYLTVLGELKTGMVYSDDGYQGQNLCTEWAMTTDVVTTLERMVPALVEHMYCDNAVLELMTSLGAVRYLPEVRIEHRHPIAGKAETDAQYERVNSREQFRRDRQTFIKWQRRELAGQVAALRELREGLPEVRPEVKGKPVRDRTRSPIPRFFRKVRGASSDEIGLALADMAVRVPGDQAIVELGVFQGRTALLMAWGASQGGRAHVWGVDAWDLPGNTYGPPFTDTGSRQWARYNVKALGYGKRVTLVHNFAVRAAREWVTRPDLIGLGNRPVGLLFVDDDHSYEGARDAILAWAPHLAPGATIAVDDYGHPDWPGVAQAVDALVDEGVLEPVEVFHDQLAVTRLADPHAGPDPVATQPEAAPQPLSRGEEPRAITSEGVSPSPRLPSREALEAEWERVDPDGVAALRESAARLRDTSVSNETVLANELPELVTDTTIDKLNTFQLRALAKARGIVLGARKDKRAAMVQALRDGQ